MYGHKFILTVKKSYNFLILYIIIIFFPGQVFCDYRDFNVEPPVVHLGYGFVRQIIDLSSRSTFS